MTAPDLSVLGLAFFAGLVVGVCVTATWDDFRGHVRFRLGATRHTQGMELPTAPPRSKLVTLVVLAALLSSGVSTFVSVTTGADLKHLTDCSVRYNIASGAARDERAAAAKQSTKLDLRTWRDLRVQIADGDHTTRRTVLRTIDQRIVGLEKVLAVSAANPYPDPDTCAPGGAGSTQDQE